MAQSRVGKTLLIGAILVSFGGMTALTIGGKAGDESSPMDDLLAGGVTWDLTATRNDAVEGWITYLSGDNAKRTRLWMERSGKYSPMIRSELRRRGMPEDLLYLAFIESGFTPRAYSSAAASGIWQFIAETGRRYGLEVNSEVDERRDPLKSTGAALDYLQELHDTFGSWYLAAAAYNSGENRIARIMREETGSTRGDDAVFWRIAPRLPKETRNYVPLMLAAGYINKQPTAHGFEDVNYQDPLQFEVAWVPGGTPLSVVAKAAGVTDSAVKDLNPHLMLGRTPAKRGWAVRIPTGSRTAFDRGFSTTLAEYRVKAAAEKKLASVTRKKSP
ncbi:MAG: lytic transglycosylase domain-containing protein, partial [Longimicrobiales bacterium]